MGLLLSILVCVLPGFVLPFLLGMRRLRTPVGLFALAGLWWLAIFAFAAWNSVFSPWADPQDLVNAGKALGVGLLGLLPSAGWLAVRWIQRGEEKALLAHGATPLAEGAWRLRVGTTEVNVTRAEQGWSRRLLDRRAHVFSVSLPIGEATIEPRHFGDPPMPWRYQGPRHLRALWLSGEVPALLGGLLDRRGARVAEGVLHVPTRAWLNAVHVRQVLTEIEGVVEAVRGSGRDAVARIQAEARGEPGHVHRDRVEAWRTLADHLPEGLAAVAPEGLRDPDPVIRAIAAGTRGDRAGIADVIARSDDAEAIRRAVAAVRANGWADLVDPIAARIGVPPEATWFDLVAVVGELGGRAHVARLAEVVGGAGFPAGLRAAAQASLGKIRARLGAEAVGRVALVAGESGQVALAAEGGEVSVVGDGS